jgi:hypothetical protein
LVYRFISIETMVAYLLSVFINITQTKYVILSLVMTTIIDSGGELPVVKFRGGIKPGSRQADPVKVCLLDPALPLAVWVLFLVRFQPFVEFDASIVDGHTVQVSML